MAEIFKMDQKDLKRLRKFYRQAPEMFEKSAAATLNNLAFGTRREAIKIIDSKMTIRNAKFIHGSVKVRKASPNMPLNKMKAITGSVERPRYTGLAEQELGTRPSRNRAFTEAARGGDEESQTKGWARLKSGKDYPSPSKANLSGLSGAKRIVAFLHMLSESRAAQTFILRKRFGRFKRGLYRFKQGVVRLLQSFDTRGKPKRIRWLTEGRRAYVTKQNILQIWADSINFQLKKRK